MNGMTSDSNQEEGNKSNDAWDDDILGKVAMNLITNGLQVRMPIDEPLSPHNPDACSILIRHPASGQYAQVSYISSGDDPAEILLELTYRTAPDTDPDGSHMTDRVVRLLSTAPG